MYHAEVILRMVLRYCREGLLLIRLRYFLVIIQELLQVLLIVRIVLDQGPICYDLVNLVRGFVPVAQLSREIFLLHFVCLFVLVICL